MLGKGWEAWRRAGFGRTVQPVWPPGGVPPSRCTGASSGRVWLPRLVQSSVLGSLSLRLWSNCVQVRERESENKTLAHTHTHNSTLIARRLHTLSSEGTTPWRSHNICPLHTCTCVPTCTNYRLGCMRICIPEARAVHACTIIVFIAQTHNQNGGTGSRV